MVRHFLGLVLVVSLMPPAQASAAQAGRVVALRGKAWKTVPGAEVPARTPLVGGDRLHEGDVVSTDADSSARLLMSDKSILDVGPRTRVTIKTYQTSPKERKRKVGLTVWLGRLWARVTKSTGGGVDFRVSSPNAVAGIRGTELVVDVAEGLTEVTVVSGSVEVGTAAREGIQILGAMQRGSVSGSGGGNSGSRASGSSGSTGGNNGGASGDGGSEGGGQRDQGASDGASDSGSPDGGGAGGSVDDGGGAVTVTEVDPAEVQEMAETVRPATQFETREAEAEVASGGASPEQSSGPTEEAVNDDAGAEDVGTETETETETEVEPPPLDLDPASGQGRVRGTIEVRP